MSFDRPLEEEQLVQGGNAADGISENSFWSQDAGETSWVFQTNTIVCSRRSGRSNFPRTDNRKMRSGADHAKIPLLDANQACSIYTRVRGALCPAHTSTICLSMSA